MRSRPRPAKRQAKSKTSEIQRCRLLKDAWVSRDRQKSTEVPKSTESWQQSTTNLSLCHWRRNELQKGRWPSHKNSVLLIRQKHNGRPSTETHWKVYLSSPTDLANALPDAVYWGMHWEVDWEVCAEVDQHKTVASNCEQLWGRPDGHRIGLPKMITKSRQIYVSMPST